MDEKLVFFSLLVEEMRHNQKEYFKTRNTAILKLSKKLESRVDEYILILKSERGIVEEVKPKDLPQLKLFDGVRV